MEFEDASRYSHNAGSYTTCTRKQKASMYMLHDLLISSFMATVLLFLTFQVHKAVALGLGDAVSNCSSNSPLMFWKKLP